ncbi:hypothetical protein [Actibacterium lipolyticum]|uniref:Uncharacterized protein n=1 Tax=Actibacterium lipolyticum TaxID=1524263 RepID=A0A238KIU7_9RHOB|nr:hypothetical protein [Actibacterium lipolyticum]SMX42650.1 hypothetical protein COL8621_02037 [Actibacterium lipolyticum]
MDSTIGTLILLSIAVLMVVLLKRGVDRPTVDPRKPDHTEKRKREYLEMARRDGIDPNVAKAFEAEKRHLGQDIRRRQEKARQRDQGGDLDPTPGWDFDGDF